MKKHRGSCMIVGLFTVALILALVTVGYERSAQELRAASLFAAKSSAEPVAEAGIDVAVQQLNDAMLWLTLCGQTLNGTLGTRTYSATVSCPSSNVRQIVSIGTVPSFSTGTVTSTIEAYDVIIPIQNLLANAIWAAKTLALNGNAYSVEGDVITSEGGVSNTQNIVGTFTSTSYADPLPALDRNQLYAMAKAQGNVFDGSKSNFYPTSFWYKQPTDPGDSTTGIPNIVYVKGDLVLNGNIPPMGGFYYVEGSTTINGNGSLDGVVYSNQDFSINGGGQGFNINGETLAENVMLNGNDDVSYNAEFVKALGNTGLRTLPSIKEWRELK